jgi:hypothetical protein
MKYMYIGIVGLLILTKYYSVDRVHSGRDQSTEHAHSSKATDPISGIRREL